MNILICARCLTDGGAERVASLWAKGFCQRGHRVSMVLLEGAMPITYQVPDEVAIHKLYLSNGKHFNSIRIIKSIRSIVKREKADLVITVLHPSGMLTRLATIGMKVPVVFTDHNTYEWEAEADRNTRQERFYKFHFNKLFSCVTVLTDVDRSILSKTFRHVYTLPNPLTYSVADTIPNKENVVLAAGRLDRWKVKGFDTLIQAWSLIAGDFKDWKLLIAGKGTKQSEDFLMDMVKKNHMESQVVLCGFKDDMLPLYKKASIFVLSSRYEGFGMVLIEAMSQGCAVVACDYKGRQKEIVNNSEIGFVCQSGNPEDLANALKKIMEGDSFRSSLQNKSLLRAADYNLDIIMDRWELIISDII